VFFVGQAVAQRASTLPYSLYSNTISDLGATSCGPAAYGTYHTDVCSPLSGVMNAAFIVTGLLTAAGAIGTWPAWPRRRLTTLGLLLLVLAGAGEVLVGLRPENISFVLHTVGTVFGLAGANLGLVFLGAVLWRPRRWTAVLTIAIGLVGLISFLTFNVVSSLGLGVGLEERLVGYPAVLWLMAAGIYLLWSDKTSGPPPTA
jgi:hypothetical membrane protein